MPWKTIVGHIEIRGKFYAQLTVLLSRIRYLSVHYYPAVPSLRLFLTRQDIRQLLVHPVKIIITWAWQKHKHVSRIIELSVLGFLVSVVFSLQSLQHMTYSSNAEENAMHVILTLMFSFDSTELSQFWAITIPSFSWRRSCCSRARGNVSKYRTERISQRREIWLFGNNPAMALSHCSINMILK